MEIPAAVLEWLLQADNPPVRYLTLTNLLRKPPESAELRKARARLMDYSVTQEILRHADAFQGDDEDRAYCKYTGKYWQLIFLGQFLPNGRDPRIAGWARDILEAMYSLALLDVPMSPALKRPLGVVRQKMTKEGTWLLENSLNGKMLADVEEKGKPSKWLTCFGHHVLQHFGPGE